MINDLLYNYQNSNEFVCSDGRMSVNGICKVQQQDSVEAAETTQNIIDMSKNISRDDGDNNTIYRKDYEKRKANKILDDIAKDSTPDYFPDLGKEKKSFSWDMDKPSKIGNFTKTISDGINTYDSYVEQNFGISKGVQTAARIGVTAYNVASGGGALAVLGPFAIPALVGMGMNKKEKERVQAITNQDTQGKNDRPIDMMTYDIPTAGQTGFNPHNDAGDRDNNNNSGHNAPGAGKGEGGGYASDYGFI